MKKASLFMSILFSAILLACSSSSDEEMVPNPDSNEKVTYNGNIKAILSSNCLGCHGSTPSNGAPSSYDTYTKAKAAIDKIITRTNSTSSPMPVGGLMPLETRNLIKKWKSDGLLEN